jgi:hypothetical protein
MVEEVLEGRYKPVRSVLEEQLKFWYPDGNFRIIVCFRNLCVVIDKELIAIATSG